ncbi:MAG: type II toxin-antitoxin system Phd/YefM family antitoxin [Gemmatimonadetes bacterium]|nr:type II toxin-antitoxin system Phd/YefM family antitoxin [Gemmatimonadota bacterium]
MARLLATLSPGALPMPFASVADVKNRLSEYLARARKTNRPIVVTRHGKPYALIQPLSEREAEDLIWSRLAERRLGEAWEGEDDALYDYL